MDITSPTEAISRLKDGNAEYISSTSEGHNAQARLLLGLHGQKPYAVIVACSDSRTPPEIIFGTDINELFVVRTAGNIIGDFELGSIEYAVKHLEVKLIVVLGHDQCGAVLAAMKEGEGEGHIKYVLDEIRSAIAGAPNAKEAERLNIVNTYNKILKSEIVAQAVNSNAIKVMQAHYSLATGRVVFL